MWIKCNEKLPESTNLVLAVASGKPHENITLHSAIVIASFLGKEGWLVEEYPDWETPEVTHWMPLPELPKSE